MKKVYKYGTGETIPEGAIYLKTIKQTKQVIRNQFATNEWQDCWLVWHYFLVEVNKK